MPHPTTPFPTTHTRDDFPILAQRVHDRPLIYLDNAASTQQPRQVIDAMSAYASLHHANVHRGVHALSQRATEMLEQARARVQAFLNAPNASQIVFTKGTTEALNMVAFGWALQRLQPGDEILLSMLEHHANLVPWQEVAARTGACLRFLPVSPDNGTLLPIPDDAFGARTKLLCVAHASNVTGEILPVAELIARAQGVGAVVVLDGAQAAPHLPVDVAALGCDFYAFSGHKMCGPTGIGILYGKAERLEEMAPLHFGGAMIASVGWTSSQYADPPHRFEAGTPPIAAAIGLAAALDYLDALGMDQLAAHEVALVRYAQSQIEGVANCRWLGPDEGRVAALSLVSDTPGIHPFDIGQWLDVEGIAIRTGHHCAQPLMAHLGLPGTARASFSFYNTFEEVDAFVSALTEAIAALA